MTATDSAAPHRPVRADARRNYDGLIDAARAAFTELGADASLEDIARRAEVGIGTLYRHFPNRLSLVEAVYRDDVDGLSLLSSNEDLPPWDALVAWLERFVQYATTKRALFTELAEALGKDSEVISYCRDRLRDAATEVLGRAQRAGVARADAQPMDVLRLIGGFVMGPQQDPEQSQRLLGWVFDALRAPAPTATPTATAPTATGAAPAAAPVATAEPAATAGGR
jgi:AcrR family transcriptional regulator